MAEGASSHRGEVGSRPAAGIIEFGYEGNQAAGLKQDPDGGLTIYLHPGSPGKERAPNRLLTSAARAAYITTWITPEIPPWLRQIRRPYTLEAGLAAYENHLGPGTGG